MTQFFFLLLLLTLDQSQSQWTSFFNGWQQQQHGSLHQNGHTYGHRRQSSSGLLETVPLLLQPHQNLPSTSSNNDATLPKQSQPKSDVISQGIERPQLDRQPQRVHQPERVSISRQFPSFPAQEYPQRTPTTTTSFQTRSNAQIQSSSNSFSRFVCLCREHLR